MKEHGTDEIQSENTDNKKIIFCLVFSIVASVSYVVCDLYKLPLFTFYPAVNEFAFGFAKMTESQGPAMYWYGWIGTSALFALKPQKNQFHFYRIYLGRQFGDYSQS